MLKVLLYSLLLSVTNQSLAADPLNHQHNGCPINSECSEVMGKKRAIWITILDQEIKKKRPKYEVLNDTIKKNGTPFTLWWRGKIEKEDEIITWDSPCEHHNTPENYTKIAVAYPKNLDDLKMNEKMVPNIAYLSDGNAKPEEFIIPRDNPPLYIKNKELYFLNSEEGLYYSTKIAANGKITSVPTIKDWFRSRSVECPTELKTHILKNELERKIHMDYLCKRYQDMGNKKFYVLAYGWSCQ